uniref:Uncharacterized protein n=1 Tax=Globisporangium ultimum (strain ATCC 200006 / CBS 805.95 / DAOM BR144) TaxID=431595 RepID=K3X0F2_GLOUD
MISAIAWVPKGASRRMPEKLKLTEAEMQMMHQLAADEAAEEREEMEAAMADVGLDSDNDIDSGEDAAAADEPQNAGTDQHGLPASFKMDEYDDEDDDVAITNFIGRDVASMEEVNSDDNDEDGEDAEPQEGDDEEDMEDNEPMIDENDENDDDEDDENDKEDIEILPTDAVILVASTEEEFSNLEVHVYDDDNGSLYIHHEINLPAFPLALAWMDCAPVPLDPSTGPVDGSFVAIGTFKPGIEIWNLDVLDVLEPSATLGGEESDELRDVAMPKMSKRRKNQPVTLKPGSHTDAVMSLDWNSSHRNMLASGSADSTVKVWDITTQTCLYTMNHHTSKVQSVRWNPAETTVLASAAFDRSIVVLDGRQPDAFSKFALSADVESLTWAPHNPSTIVAATEDGVVAGFDVRMNGSAPLFRFDAHAGAVSAISFSSHIPGMFATAGVDKTVKIWDLLDNKPVCITSKDMNVGELFSMSFYRDSPYMLAVGGSKGTLALWDTSENEGVERRFGSRAQGVAASSSTSEIASSFKNAYDLGEELAQQEEEERKQQQQTAGKKKGGKSKGKK